MPEQLRPPGKTTVAPEVLLNIARLTALSVEGVSRMSSAHSSLKHLTSPRHTDDGVHVSIEDGQVDFEIFVVLKKGVNLRKVSREIQANVSRAISEMVGMQAGRVNIHIEDIDYSTQS